MSMWQFIIIEQPARAGQPALVVTHGAQALITSKPDVAAHTFLMAWRGKALVPPESWPRIECWARQEVQPDECGLAFGRDWA